MPRTPQEDLDCLEMYFKEKCPANQFLGRAYLCQAQLNAPGSAENRDELETASAYFIKTIDFAKHHPRYHFLIFNTSVLYWQMSRLFSMPGSRKFLIPSLTRILNALEEIGESDFHWRATLMLELLESLLDAGNLKDAAKYANEAALFIKTNVPHLYQKIFSLQVTLFTLFHINNNISKSGLFEQIYIKQNSGHIFNTLSSPYTQILLDE
uniref:Uncharacterized protein n=1 Tax=Erpetoichthys calabaricus TaxID=27687 RepID=A0A8C4SDZ0_ERPCA